MPTAGGTTPTVSRTDGRFASGNSPGDASMISANG